MSPYGNGSGGPEGDTDDGTGRAAKAGARVTNLILFTGKGGSGVTTLAAATAAHGAQRGMRTLLLSLGSLAHDGDGADLATVLDHPVGAVPTQVDGLLYAQSFAPQVAFEQWYGKAVAKVRTLIDRKSVV